MTNHPIRANYLCWLMIATFAMMTSALVTNVANNKYIIIFQRICAIYNNSYNYNKFRFKNNFM